MLLTITIAFWAVVPDFVLGGLLSNGFIIAVTISEWAKKRSLAASEQLLLSMGISNVSVTILLIVYLILPDYDLTYHANTFLMHIFYFGFTCCVVLMRYCLTAWLCVFYCIKILNSTHPFILWWKMRISRLVPRLIMVSLVISFLVSFFLMLSHSMRFQSDGTTNMTNIIEKREMLVLTTDSRNILLTFGTCLPLLIVFLCCVLIVSSLCQHVCRMTNKDLQTEAHIKAARTVLSHLFLYIAYFGAQTAGMILNIEKEQVSFLVVFTVLWMFSPVQAAILMLSNPKLKQPMLQIFAKTKHNLPWFNLKPFS